MKTKIVLASFCALFLLISGIRNLQDTTKTHQVIQLDKGSKKKVNLLIKEDTVIRGKKSTLIGSDKNKPVIKILGDIKVRIKNLNIIDGTNRCVFPPGCRGQAIRIEGQAKVILENINIVNYPMNGIHIYNKSKVVIRNSHLSKNGVGLATYDHSKVEVYNTEIEKSTDDGIWTWDDSEIFLSKCSIHDNLSDGLEIKNNSIVKMNQTQVYDNKYKDIRIFDKGKVEKLA